MLTKTNILGRADIGDWFPYFGTTLPAGFLWCDGRPLVRTDPLYIDLFTKISTRWGAGDGTTTFNIPDSRGRIIPNHGTSDAITLPSGVALPTTALGSFAATQGSAVVTLTDYPAHTHPQDGTHNHGGAYNQTHTHSASLAPMASRTDSIKNGSGDWGTPIYAPYHAGSDGSLDATDPADPGLDNAVFTPDGTNFYYGTGVTLGQASVDGVNGHGASASPHENMMPWMVCPYIIKYAY